MTIQDDLVPIQVTFPLDHCGDVIGVLSTVGGWIDHGPVDSDPSKILARVPKSALFTVQKWLSENLDGRHECTFVPTGQGTA